MRISLSRGTALALVGLLAAPTVRELFGDPGARDLLPRRVTGEAPEARRLALGDPPLGLSPITRYHSPHLVAR